MVIYDIKNGKCEDTFKVKVFDDNTKIVTKGWIEK
jgi:hypothetical protein